MYKVSKKEVKVKFPTLSSAIWKCLAVKTVTSSP